MFSILESFKGAESDVVVIHISYWVVCASAPLIEVDSLLS